MQNKNRITEFLNKVKDSEVNSEQSAFVFSCDSKFGESENSGEKCTNFYSCNDSVNYKVCINRTETCSSSVNKGDCSNLPPSTITDAGCTVLINTTVQNGCGC
jgi:hypothetical protein